MAACSEEDPPGKRVTATLREEDWKILAEEMEAPTAGYHPQLFRLKEDQSLGEPLVVPGRLLLPYVEAVAQAQVVSDA